MNLWPTEATDGGSGARPPSPSRYSFGNPAPRRGFDLQNGVTVSSQSLQKRLRFLQCQRVANQLFGHFAAGLVVKLMGFDKVSFNAGYSCFEACGCEVGGGKDRYYWVSAVMAFALM